MKRLFVMILVLFFAGCISTQKQTYTQITSRAPIAVAPTQLDIIGVEEGRIVSPKYSCYLYKSPSFNSDSIADLGKGQHLQLLGIYNDWY